MRVSWLLSVKASLPGVDYDAVFNVPVFATEASDQSFVTADGRRSQPPASSGVRGGLAGLTGLESNGQRAETCDSAPLLPQQPPAPLPFPAGQ